MTFLRRCARAGLELGRFASPGLAALTVAGLLVSCGGGGSFGNAPDVSNPAGALGQTLAYPYFQKCINPIFLAQLQIQLNGSTATNTCSGAGCHAILTGTGGAFRIVPGAQPLDLTDPANTPDVIRASDMYKNYFSAQGEVVVGVPTQSKLFQKPLLLGVNHGGGLIFPSQDDPNAKLINYWITHPAPVGEDEFSTTTYSMFTPPDPATGTCNTQ